MESPISIKFRWPWRNDKGKDSSQPAPSLLVPAIRVAEDVLYSTLGPATQDITGHQELLRAGIMGPVRDVVCLLGGTPGDMLADFHDLAERQHLLNNLGVLAAFSGTRGNLRRLKAIQAHHEPRVRRAGGPKGKLGVYDLTSHHVIARTIDSLSPDALDLIEPFIFMGEYDLEAVKHRGFAGQEMVPQFYSLQELRYQKQVQLYRQPRQHMTLKVLTELARRVRVADVEVFPRDEARRQQLMRLGVASHPQCYLHEDEIERIIAERQRALENPEALAGEPESFLEPKR